MENIERRLELIRMMRSEHRENINRLQKREHILYPDRRASYSDRNTFDDYRDRNYEYRNIYSEKGDIDSVGRDKNWGFYLRLIVSITLFLTFFYMDISNTSYLGVTCDMVQSMISDTFDLKSFAFMK